MTPNQGLGVASAKTPFLFPSTRYQGSKRKIAQRIVSELSELDYASVLDAFGGTGAVSYAFKIAGKHVTYNDTLRFNEQIGVALIENDSVTLDDDATANIGERRDGVTYGSVIQNNFSGIYFTDEENQWLDVAVGNIRAMGNRFAQSLAWFSLFQSAMSKRPYNLFHRRNLYMRTSEVERSFGNKKTWDRSFEDHFRKFAALANASIVDGGNHCVACCKDAMDFNARDMDLVYIDPPYVSASGTGVDYHSFYHFLEGMMHYDDWSGMIDRNSKHLRLLSEKNGWCSEKTNEKMFHLIFEKYESCLIAVSYRSDGSPSIEVLVSLLNRFKANVRVVDISRHQYALSNRKNTREMLIVGF